ncbi:hypothetical protein V5O48_016391 [Marasmius crinis-equi]|uniref:Uncharacterized protein n=1 Tax=Marasmius crinis-equi TaxID=585013 RepID=A0ABR3ES12_9AGAR
MSSVKPVVVIAGLGLGGGTGGASARAFAKEGYSVALIARNADALKAFENELKSSGIDAASFPIPSYSAQSIQTAFTDLRSHFPHTTHTIRAGIYNAGSGVSGFKPFLDATPDDVKASNQASIEGAFAFSREVILEFKSNEVDEGTGKRGVLIHTGATASVRGNVMTSLFASGKHALRALSQSLAKEFGRENIHVAHAIIDGNILTTQQKDRRKDPEWEKNEAVRLDPDSIAAAYVYLAKQDQSSWTWELDLRPAHEKW